MVAKGLKYFRQINILGFILIYVVLCNLSQIDSKVFSSARGFFLKRVFTLIFCFSFILYLFIVQLIVTMPILETLYD